MGENNRILVIDDEWIVLDSIKSALEDLGYSVDAVLNGDDAMRHLMSDAASYAAIITDVDINRGIDGWSVARLAREVLPSIAVIYCTGQPPDQWRSHGLAESRLVRKPFIKQHLVHALEDLTGVPEDNCDPTIARKTPLAA